MKAFGKIWMGVAVALAGCGGGGGSGDAPAPPPATFNISVTVSGLDGTGLVLRNNGGNPLTITANGAATFSTALATGAQYAVTVDTQPSNPSQTCTVTSGTGTVANANVTNISVTCTTNRYTVGGTVAGLAGSGLVLLQGSEELAISADGDFTFPTDVISGGSFDVRVLRHPVTPNQYCRVTNGTGSVTNAAITAISVECATNVPRFAYSVDYDSASVSIYGIDASTGQLRPRGHVRAGLKPILLFSDEEQRFWFVLNQGDATVSVFEQDPVTAALTEVAGSPYATDGIGGEEDVGPSWLQVHPSGKFVYVVNGPGTDDIAAFAVNAADGTLTKVPGSPFAAGSDPFRMTLDRTGRFAYVTNRGSDDISIYSIDPATGALTELAEGSPVATGDEPGVLTFHDSGRFVYVPNTAGDNISAFSVDAETGQLTPIAGSPFASGTNPSIGALIHPSGKFLYLRNAGVPDSAGSVSAFAIDQTSGALTPIGTPAPIGENSNRTVMDPAGKFLFIANRGSVSAGTVPGSVSAFRIDPTTGALQTLPGLPPGLPVSTVIVDPSGKYVYTTDPRTDAHIAFEFDEVNGTLKAVPGAYVRGRRQPVALGVYSSVRSPAAAIFRSKFAYVPNGTDNTISAFAIDSSSGELTSVNSVASAGASPRSAAVHPSGRFLAASHEGGPLAGIATYPLDVTTGALSASVSSISSGGGAPSKVIVSPHGRNAYLLNAPRNLIQGYSIDSAGALTEVPPPNGINTVQPGKDIAIAPNGSFLHFIRDDGWGRDRFDENGSFTGTGGVTGLVAGKTAFAIDPQGLFAYVAVAGSPSGTLEMFAVLVDHPGIEAALQFRSSIATGTNPVAVAVDPTGRFVYTANSGSNDISTFVVDHIAGTLTELSPRVSAGTDPGSIAVDYSGKHLYVLSRGTNEVLTYSIDTATGALTASSAEPASTGAGPSQIVVSADME